MEFVKVDATLLREAIAARGFGTGTASTAARFKGGDTLQRILTTGEGEKADVDALALALRTTKFIVGGAEPEVRVPSVKEIQAAVMEGDNATEQLERAKRVLVEELARDKPRAGILKWLKDEFDLEP
jgi:hypothetical protein